MNDISSALTGLDVKLEQVLVRLLGKDGLAGLRVMGRNAIRERLQKVLLTERDRRIYELTDGENSTSQIAKAVGVTQPTIVNTWNRWRKDGIVEEVSGIRGRCRHLCSLAELDIPFDSVKPAERES